MPRTRTYVPGHGPINAKMLFVGEAPGRQEEAKGRPFVGQTGQAVRRILEDHGIEADRQVRFNNVIPYNPGQIKGGLGTLASLVHANWDNLADDLATMRPRVVVACGRAALYRLTGQYKIMEEHGGVFPVASLPTTSNWGKQSVDRGLARLPDDCVVVACVHPASVMRSAIGAGWLRIDRAISRACQYANGELEATAETPPKVAVWTPMPEELDAKLSKVTEMAIDTEFNPENNQPFLIGITVDGETVMSFPPWDSYISILKRHMMRRDLVKIAHYHVADTAALAALGVDTCGPWYDTLEAFSHLYPDLPLGLGHAALYYLDDWRNWKWMDHTDEQYNALDVIAAWELKQYTTQELAETGMLECFLSERMPISPLMSLLEDRGLSIDMSARRKSIRRSEMRETTLLGSILNQASAYFMKRIEGEASTVAKVEKNLERLQKFSAPLSCELHPTYNGLRGKKWATADNCRCPEVHATTEAKSRRVEIVEYRKQLTGPRGRLKRWESRGFDPGNNDHLRWLLYNPSGLSLPAQKKDGRLTANADAVAKLGAHPKVLQRKDYKEIMSLLRDIKEVQHERKTRSTFLHAGEKGARRIDYYHTVHPPMRAFGTGTGRPAGGSDSATEDRRPSPYSFNALNIPERTRNIYIPHDRLVVTHVVRPRFIEEDEE